MPGSKTAAKRRPAAKTAKTKVSVALPARVVVKREGAPPLKPTFEPVAFRAGMSAGFIRRRTPLTELVYGERWLGDLAPWAAYDPEPSDVPMWINARAVPARTKPWARIRATAVLMTLCGALAGASAMLFVAR
jgi:hypothetical protein